MIVKCGKQNTAEALKLAVKAAKEHKISHIVLASSKGTTAKAALAAVKGTDIKLTVVTHSTGFTQPGVQEFDEKLRKKIIESGHNIYTGIHLMRGLGRAIKNKMGFSHEDIVANTLRLFGEGTKVCVEMAAMVADAGYVPCPADIVCIAGTGRGADTVVIIQTMPSHRFFEMKVKKIIAKPSDF